MRNLSKVVWAEGMHLAPHHFQAQSRFFEDSLQFAFSSLFFKGYGFASCRLDAEALANGTAAIISARGILPDGSPFHMPESDELPPPLAIADLFSPARDSHLLLLALPATRPEGRNFWPEDASPLEAGRYIAARRPLTDETTGRDERPVLVGRKNCRLLLDSEPAEGFCTLPAARIRRSGTGRFIFDPNYIPPCVSLAAGDTLIALLSRLVSLLEDKAAPRPGGHGRDLLSAREVASFWFQHAINSSLAPLRHLLASRTEHPETLYREMARLAGALCTFSLDSNPASIPLYDHDNLEATFSALDEHIRQHLELILPTTCIEVPLSTAGDCYHNGEVADQRCFGPSRWILGVQAATGEADLIVRAPQLIKVCSEKFTPELVKRALPGMTLTHLPVPPSALPVSPEFQYFSISRGGPCWEHILATKRVGVYVPADLPSAQVRLFAVLEG